MKHTLTNINLDTRRAQCSVCGPDTRLKKRYGKQEGTFRCYNSYLAGVKKMKDGTKFRQSDIEAMRKHQDNRCAICKESRPLVVDHCHEGKQFRGLLCRECNLGLGYFKDNPDTLASAVRYLSHL